MDRLYYDRNKPFNKQLSHFDYYFPLDSIKTPKYYLIPQAWSKVIDLLRTNAIKLIAIENDSTITAGVYYINEYNTSENAYEGHYLHRDTKVTLKTETVRIKKGDFLIPVLQKGGRYVTETLEPISVDSYFNWGFFDGILQQKEWFSAYAFEDIAKNILDENENLSNEFNKLKKSDPSFASNSFAQLYFIYKNSKYFENGLMRYPVLRIGSITE